MTSVVQEARRRVFGLSKTVAERMPSTSVLGRLRATGEVSQAQYDAGARYGEVVRLHDQLLGAKGFPSAGNLDRTAGHDGGEESAAARLRYLEAMSRYDNARSALREASGEDRMASSVVDAVCVNDWDLPDMTPSLRIGLNKLVRSMGISRETIDISAKIGQPL